MLLPGVAGLEARPVQITVWISGGVNQILTAGMEAPGLLGVAEHVQRGGGSGFWVDVGGSADLPHLPGLRIPDALIPNGEILRVAGLSILRHESLPWTVLNTGILPQYPEAPPLDRPFQLLRHPDGPVLRVTGLLAANTPLQVPPAQLRPLRILDPAEALRSALPAWRREDAALNLLVLPEGADAGEWSRLFPEIPVIIEPPAAPPAVIPLDGGTRLRIRPAPHGRAVIRLTLIWDTVTREFRAPAAEIEWVRAPDLAGIHLPVPLQRRLRPLPSPPNPAAAIQNWGPQLLRRAEADLALLPAVPSAAAIPHPALPESWRGTLVPVNDGWTLLTVSGESARQLRQETLPGYIWVGEPRAQTRVALPNHVAAGLGGQARAFRRLPEDPDTLSLPLPFTTRDFFPPSP